MSFEKDTKAYSEWLENKGFQVSEKLSISDLRESKQGRGLMATEDIAEDQILFTIPREAIVNVETSSLASKPGVLEKLNKLGQWEAVIVCLLYERNILRESSKWWPYLSILPQKAEEFQQLMFWSTEELEALKPSYVVDRIGREEAESMYGKLFPRVADDLQVKEFGNITLQDFHYAATIVMSYSFDVEDPDVQDEEDDDEEQGQEKGQEEGEEEVLEEDVGEDENTDPETDTEMEETEEVDISQDNYYKSMVPLADTLNADTNLWNAKLTYSGTDLVMKSIKPINAGEQVFNTYGEHPNAEILRRYGYVEKRSKFDMAEVSLANIQEHYVKSYGIAKDHLEAMVEVIEDSQCLNEMLTEEDQPSIVMEAYDCFKDGGILPEMVLLIQILSTLCTLYTEETKWFKKMFRAIKFGKRGKLANSELAIFVNRICKKCYQLVEQEKITSAMVSDYNSIISARLTEYPVEISSGSTFKGEMAATVLSGEKECLEKCKEWSIKQKHTIIEDCKLNKNIMKRKLEEEVEKKAKKTKRA